MATKPSNQKPIDKKNAVPTLPKPPYTIYSIFFRLERAYIIQTSTGTIDEEILASLVPNHEDPLDFPRPKKYENIVLPPYWYSRSHNDAFQKKRKHRKRKGRLDLKTLSKTISSCWRKAQANDEESVKYCNKLAEFELKKYNVEMNKVKAPVAIAKSITFVPSQAQAQLPPRIHCLDQGVIDGIMMRPNQPQTLPQGANVMRNIQMDNLNKSAAAMQVMQARQQEGIGGTLRPSQNAMKNAMDIYQGITLRQAQEIRHQLAMRKLKSFMEAYNSPMHIGTSKLGGAGAGASLGSLPNNLMNGAPVPRAGGLQAGPGLVNNGLAHAPRGQLPESMASMSQLRNNRLPNGMMMPRYPPTRMHAPMTTSANDEAQAARDMMTLAAQPRLGSIVSLGSANRSTSSSPDSAAAPRVPSPPSNNNGREHAIPADVTSSNLQEEPKRAMEPSKKDKAICLFIPSDDDVLDAVHSFPRCHCIELFEKTQNDDSPGKIGQVGLRCFHCKEICYPSKRDTIYDNVLNFQRNHLEVCKSFPEKMKMKYKNLLQEEYWNKKQQLPYEFLKAYYAEAASEIGLRDGQDGLVFGGPPNRSGVPSEKLKTLIDAAVLMRR
eukprot:CAMPEP_0183723902 /NCGR_PEP_ID=MMETSP0737-20130205/16688_1 /TAXON_ID=385413 /ORGANISM="Thalassiosira miniscula, Strain CCMP1093" /LENGTH=604 /DNA_ID=CAMNT_0025954329 /DNA_START=66 /DNA_END=1880 /DNA_ORIENTATION=+